MPINMRIYNGCGVKVHWFWAGKKVHWFWIVSGRIKNRNVNPEKASLWQWRWTKEKRTYDNDEEEKQKCPRLGISICIVWYPLTMNAFDFEHRMVLSYQRVCRLAEGKRMEEWKWKLTACLTGSVWSVDFVCIVNSFSHYYPNRFFGILSAGIMFVLL